MARSGFSREMCSLIPLALLTFCWNATADTPTTAELTALKTLPSGYVVWGIGGTANGQVYGMTDWGDGVYRADLGTTKETLLDSLGHSPSINKKNPTRIAYFRQAAANGFTSDIWLMDCDGKNKKKITTQPIGFVAWVRWTDLNKLVFQGGDNKCEEYGVSKLYIMDTLGTVQEINTGVKYIVPSWAPSCATCSGNDGVMCWGDRIYFRPMCGLTPPYTTADSSHGTVLASIDQNSPQTQLTYIMHDVAYCGPAVSMDGPQPTLAAHNVQDHDAYTIINARTGAELYTIPFNPSVGYNTHCFCWSTDSLNWGYTSTREEGIWPYVVDLKNKKLIRQGWGKEGANAGSLYVGPMPPMGTTGISAPAIGRGAMLPVSDGIRTIAFDLRGGRISASAGHAGAYVAVVKSAASSNLRMVVR